MNKAAKLLRNTSSVDFKHDRADQIFRLGDFIWDKLAVSDDNNNIYDLRLLVPVL